MIEVREHNKEKMVSATELIVAGTEIILFTGKPITFKKTLELGDKESFALQIEKDLYIYLDKPARYFNHSCEPNCGLKPDLKLVSLVDINKNEELRWDYSTTMLEHNWTMKCECGKPTCRKVVGDFDKLPKALQQNYISLGIVQEFIVRMLNFGENH